MNPTTKLMMKYRAQPTAIPNRVKQYLLKTSCVREYGIVMA